MSADQEISYGTKLEVNTTGSTYVEAAEVYDITGPEYSRKVIMLKALRDAVQRNKRGRLVVGEVVVKCGYNKTNYDLLVGYIKADTAKTWRLTMPEGSTEAFSAAVTKLSKSYPDEEGIMFDVTLTPDGDTTWTKA